MSRFLSGSESCACLRDVWMSSLPVLWAGVAFCYVLRGSGYAFRRTAGLFFIVVLWAGLRGGCRASWRSRFVFT